MNRDPQSPYWSIEIEPVSQRANGTVVDASVILTGDKEQPALYRNEVAWQSLKSDLIAKKMGFQLFQPDWSDPDMKAADHALAKGENVKGHLPASVSAEELESIGFRPK